MHDVVDLLLNHFYSTAFIKQTLSSQVNETIHHVFRDRSYARKSKNDHFPRFSTYPSHVK